jgi:hypothetical protein
MKKIYLKPEMKTTAIRARKMICVSGPAKNRDIDARTNESETVNGVMEIRRRNTFDYDRDLW